MNELRVLVVARDRLARAGLAALLDQQPGAIAVGQVGGCKEVKQGLETYQPDVVLWELGWEPSVDLECLAQMPEDAPPALVLIPDQFLAADAWAAGASGLILRDIDPSRLLAGLVAVGQGLQVLGPGLPVAGPPTRSTAAGTVTALTPRELEVLRLLAEGLPNKGIASRLGISEHTAKFHVNPVFPIWLKQVMR